MSEDYNKIRVLQAVFLLLLKEGFACACSNANATNDILSCVDVVLGVVAKTSVWRDASEQDEDGCDDKTDCYKLAKDGAVGAEFGPSSAAFLDEWLHFLLAELVVEHAHNGNAVAEYLETGELGSPDVDGCGDEEDILEDTAEGEDEARGFADLEFRN